MDQNRLSQKGGNLLPEGWAETTLSEIATVNPKNGELNTLLSGFIPMALAPTDFNGHLEFEEREWDEIKKKYTHFANGDVIFAKVTPCFENGKAAIVSDLPNGIGAGSSEFYVLRPLDKGISASYIFANIKSHEFMQTGAENMTGAVGLRRVPRKFVEGFKVNLPPQAEQKVIADKLDTLLAQVENTKARLDRIPQILKTFRQSVLAAAVSGKLTGKWNLKGKMQKWNSVVLDELINESANGLSKRSGDQGKPVTILRLADFKNASRAYGKERQINLSEKELEKYCLLNGDILIIRVNGSVELAGRFIEYSSNGVPEGFCDHFIRLRLNTTKVLPTYLCFVANEGVGRIYLQGSLSTSAGQNTINQGSVKGLNVPIPSLNEQIEIVRRVEQLFAQADKIEQQVQAAQQRVDKLTQSILAKAFRGELTAQWREDNPELISGENSAEALLAKIKAEREAMVKPKRPTRAKKATKSPPKTSYSIIDEKSVLGVIAKHEKVLPQQVFNELKEISSLQEVLSEISRLLEAKDIFEQADNGQKFLVVKQ